MYRCIGAGSRRGQLGLVLRPFVEDTSPVVLGDRKRAGSVLGKEAARWGIGIKVLRHMQRMIGHAIFSRGILDTKAAFKLYESELLREIIADPTVYDFSFDTDWILAAIRQNVKLIDLLPAELENAGENDFGDPDVMSSETLRTWLRGVLHPES